MNKFVITANNKDITSTNSEAEAIELCKMYAEVNKDVPNHDSVVYCVYVDVFEFYRVTLTADNELIDCGESPVYTLSSDTLRQCDFVITKNDEVDWYDEAGDLNENCVDPLHIFFVASDIIKATAKAVYVNVTRFDENGQLNYGKTWLPKSMTEEDIYNNVRKCLED